MGVGGTWRSCDGLCVFVVRWVELGALMLGFVFSSADWQGVRVELGVLALGCVYFFCVCMLLIFYYRCSLYLTVRKSGVEHFVRTVGVGAAET